MTKKANDYWQKRYPHDSKLGEFLDAADTCSVFEDLGNAKGIDAKIQEARRSSDSSSIFFLGMRVGEIASAFLLKEIVMPELEKPAALLRKLRLGLAAARIQKGNATKSRYSEIYDAVKARMKAHPRDSITYARQIVADDLGISRNTVAAATVGMKTKKKK